MTKANEGEIAPGSWNRMMRPYVGPSLPHSLLQLATTVVPLVLVWIAMVALVDRAYGVTLLLSIPAGLLVVRLFMIQHDCGHGAFFRSRLANDLLGNVLGVPILVPYLYWRRAHSVHHATSGNLDRRKYGDIDTLTVKEYLAMSRGRRIFYRFYRNPIVLLLVGPIFQFVIKHRFPWDIPRSWKKEWAGVVFTNLAIAAAVTAFALTIGLRRFLAVQIPIIFVSGSIGVLLFYVQHQFEETYWRKNDRWDYFAAALQGSSYLALPGVLRWFTANIGYHHVHHLDSRIPNYRLKRCHDENPELQRATRITIRDAMQTLRLALWDEEAEKLVGFRHLRALAARS